VHLLELQNDPQGNYDIVDITAAGRNTNARSITGTFIARSS